MTVRDGHLLMVRRGRSPGAGKWSVPGGRVEPGERPEQAVVRELMEETGIAGECGAMIGAVERRGPGYHFVILDFWLTPMGDDDPVAGDDADEVAWVPLAEVVQLPLVEGLASFLTAHGVVAGP